MTKKFNLHKARKAYDMKCRYLSAPGITEQEEQINFLKYCGVYSLKTATNQGVTVEKARKSQRNSAARKVFNDLEGYLLSLTKEQKLQIPEYCYDQAHKIQSRLNRIENCLNYPTNIPLIPRILANISQKQESPQTNRELLEEYLTRSSGISLRELDDLDAYELNLFSSKIYSTSKKIFSKLSQEDKEILTYCNDINQKLGEIGQIKDKTKRLDAIKSLEDDLNLEEFEERIGIQLESYKQGEKIPAVLQEANRTLGYRYNLKSLFNGRYDQRQTESLLF